MSLWYEAYLAFSKGRKSFLFEWCELERKVFVYLILCLFSNVFFYAYLSQRVKYFYEAILLFSSHVMFSSSKFPVL